MDRLSTLTSKLGKAYDAFKAAEKEFAGTKGKKAEPGLKQKFFEEATQTVRGTLAQKTIEIDVEDSDEALAEAEKRNPKWRVIKLMGHKGAWRLVLEERPEFKSFVYINKEDKRVWTKKVNDGTPYLDEERLQKADPDLWERVTVPARQLKPLEDLPQEDLAELEEYIYPGKPVVQLAQPRKAKKEELE